MKPDTGSSTTRTDGSSEAPRDGTPYTRRPGELAFALFLTIASLFLLHSAYGIAGFEALSSPGAVPMATTFVMSVTALVIAVQTLRRTPNRTETLARDILPVTVLLFVGLLVAFGLLLKPLGFLPTAALFLSLAVKLLGRRGWGYTLAVSLGSLAVIWIIFRIVFTVLLPAGILPEAEFIQFFRDLWPRGSA